MSDRPPHPSASRWLRILGVVFVVLCGVEAWAAAREVRLGVYSNEPKVFVGADGQPSGIFGDLLSEIAAREGWVIRPVVCEWQACLDALAAGGIDLMPDVAYSEERTRHFDFHQIPALHSWSQLYALPGAKWESVLDLAGLRVAVLEGSVQERFFRTMLEGFGVAVQWRTVPSLDRVFELVADGEADVAVANHRYGNRHAPTFRLEPTPIMFQPSRLFWVVARGHNSDLLEAVDRHLVAWKTDKDSVYYEILDRWADVPSRGAITRQLLWGMVGVVLLLSASTLAAWVFRRQVREQTRQLRASEQRLNTILDSVEGYIYIKDPSYRYTYANQKVCDLVGRPLEAVLGQTDEAIFDTQTATRLRENDRRVIERGERISVEETNAVAKDSEPRTFLSVKLPLRDATGRVYALCGISTDLTDHKRAQDEIHRLAFYDPLTGLPNRRLLIDRLQLSLAAHARSGQDGALLFIDLDDFKTLNDTLGHDTGDQLLQQVAQRLREQMREGDTLARLGGDEFVVMLSGLGPLREDAARQAEKVATKLRMALARAYQVGGHHHDSTVSIGVALFTDAQNSLDNMLRWADMAMYQAKADGRNNVRFFNPDMQAQLQARAELETDLRDAVAAGQFELHYQPQVDASGHILGAEALLRWHHPTRGMVPPALFIPVAESSGLILPLGRWILCAACRQLVLWAEHLQTAPWRVAVNVSAKQFHHTDFVADVLAALRDTGANPSRLELELTESQLVEDMDSVIAKMSVLRAHGVRFALDDFGTGYSSLAYLKRLPLYKLKIDQGFVRDLLTDHNDAAIVRTIVALGNSLDLEVIAEGVETEEQKAALADLGCRQYQGYLLGRPAPAATLGSRVVPREM